MVHAVDIADTQVVTTRRGWTQHSILTTTSEFDDYRYRGDELRDLCLYDYCSLIIKVAGDKGVDFDPAHPLHERWKQQMRRNRAVPILIGRLTFLQKVHPTPEDTEDNFCLLAHIFIPWNAKRPLKMQGDPESWESVFGRLEDSISPRLRWHIANLALLRKTREEVELDRAARKE